MAFIDVKKCMTDPKQLIKLIVLIVCLCITCYQLSECVGKLISPPVSTHYKFQLNESLIHPAVTICRKPAYKVEMFPKFGVSIPMSGGSIIYDGFFNNFSFDEFTLEQFVNETTFSFREMFNYCSFNRNYYPGEGNDVVKIRSAYHLNRGRCYTMIPQQASFDFTINGGHYFFLKHDASGAEGTDNEGLPRAGFEVFFHGAEEVLTDVAGQADSFTEYIYLPAFEMAFVALNFAEFVQVNTKQKPCVSDPKYSRPKCQEQCIHRTIAESVGCTTPWLKHMDKHYPLCNTSEQLNNVTRDVTYDINGWKAKKCKCIESCEVNLYTAIVDRREKDNVTTDIKIYASSNVVNIAEEVISYDLNVFISDIGGSMGFLLGLSVIGILKAIENLIRLFFIRRNSTKAASKEADSKENTIFEEAINEEKKMDRINGYLADIDAYERRFETIYEDKVVNKY